MRVRPTLAVVRAVMDRYRRIIERTSADPVLMSRSISERLMKNLQAFLQRDDVIAVLSTEATVAKQREKLPSPVNLEPQPVSEEGWTRPSLLVAGSMTNTTVLAPQAR